MNAAIILTVAMLAEGAILKVGDSRQALGSDYKLEMPKEAFGLSGTLSARWPKHQTRSMVGLRSRWSR